MPIWPYQFFNALQSDRRSDPNTVLLFFTLNFYEALHFVAQLSDDPGNKTITVQTSSATPDLLLIQLNLFCWTSMRSRVAEFVYTFTNKTYMFVGTTIRVKFKVSVSFSDYWLLMHMHNIIFNDTFRRFAGDELMCVTSDCILTLITDRA